MSRELNEIREQLGIFSSKYAPVMVSPATVITVKDNDTCVIEFINGTKIYDCRLKSIIKEGNKFVLVPKQDSIVLVERIGNAEEYFVCAVHEITEIKQVIDKVAYSMDTSGFLLKNDDVTMRSFLLDLIKSMRDEKHLTNYGPTIGLDTTSLNTLTQLENKAKKLFKDA